jgi:hypothetical protein
VDEPEAAVEVGTAVTEAAVEDEATVVGVTVVATVVATVVIGVAFVPGGGGTFEGPVT